MKRLALLALVLAGCSQSLGHLATLAPPRPDAPRAAGPIVRGKSCAHWVVGVPLGAPSLEAATRAAEAKAGGALVDVEVKKSFWTTMVYGQECLIVDAHVATTTKEPS